METLNSVSQRFLHFTLERREFAVKLDFVREVIGFPDFTPVPNGLPHFLGLMTLRDEIIPLIDLRLRLGFEPTLSHDTAVIICKLPSTFVGVVVDSISSVSAPDASIVYNSPRPQNAAENTPVIIPQVIKMDSNLILVLDIPETLSTDEKILIEADIGKRAA